jgi:hypothetical protein
MKPAHGETNDSAGEAILVGPPVHRIRREEERRW